MIRDFLPLNIRIFDMSFECASCNKKVTYTAMAGLVFGQITSATLASKGVQTTKSGLAQGFSKHEFTAGTLNGLGIKCNACSKTDWR